VSRFCSADGLSERSNEKETDETNSQFNERKALAGFLPFGTGGGYGIERALESGPAFGFLARATSRQEQQGRLRMGPPLLFAIVRRYYLNFDPDTMMLSMPGA
jgi:hypothetical protein